MLFTYSLNIHPTWSKFNDILNITTLFPKDLKRPHSPWFVFKTLHILKFLHPANRVSYFPDFSERLKEILLAGLSFHCCAWSKRKSTKLNANQSAALQWFPHFRAIQKLVFLEALEVCKLTPQYTKMFCLKCLEIWKLVTQNHKLHSLEGSSCTNRLCHCHF